MTKNEDVSWIPKPAGFYLRRFSTSDLIAELATRGGVESANIECEDGIATTLVVHGRVVRE